MRTTFITSAAEPAQFPDVDGAEFAFVGRSNVGKSTLLNALVTARVARTSRTPGRTQLVNFFNVHTGQGDFTLADLPGYGFARAPKDVQRKWAPLIESYLRTRVNLKAALVLIDIRRELAEDDRALLQWLTKDVAPRGVRVELIGTKADKLPKSKQKPALTKIARAIAPAPDAIHLTSASHRQGLEPLLVHLQTLAGLAP
ncbi:MAG: ribosome biogenesis GTP-binding protein YihA/YsxC [Myxococcota bacterium]